MSTANRFADWAPSANLPNEFLAVFNRESDISIEPFALTTALFGINNPFWHEGRARFFWTDQTCFVGFKHLKYLAQGQQFATFGYWRANVDTPSIDKLFVEFENWCRADGINHVLGPINFKTCYDYRLRLDYFHEQAMPGEPHHPQFFLNVMERAHFKPVRRYYTDTIFDLFDIRRQAQERLPQILNSTSDDLVRLEPFSKEAWRLHQPKLLPLVNKIFAGNSAFLELTDFDFNLLYSDASVAKPCLKTSCFVTAQNGDVVGFSLHFADPNRPKRLLVKTTGLLPDYRNGGRTFIKILNRIIALSNDYDEISFCLMAEDNMAHRLARKYSEETKSYALFAKTL